MVRAGVALGEHVEHLGGVDRDVGVLALVEGLDLVRGYGHWWQFGLLGHQLLHDGLLSSFLDELNILSRFQSGIALIRSFRSSRFIS